MLRASWRFAVRRIELLFATFNTGAGSFYWLALAFVLPIEVYGRMMGLQASILIVGLVFALRTHDLVFYGVRSLGYSMERSFRIALTIEWGTVLASVALVVLVFAAVVPQWAEGIHPAQLAGYALVTGIGANQGAGTAKLRFLGCDRAIVFADGACIAGWLVAVATIPFARHSGMLAPLALGAAPMAVRASWLAIAALGARIDEEPAAGGLPPVQEMRSLARYLSHGQVTNFAKNGAVSLETAILTAFLSPQIVGLYRVVRGAAGVSTAALNVIYQKGFPQLVKAGTADDRRAIGRRLDRNSLLLQLAVVPLAALVVAGYAFAKPEVTLAAIMPMFAGVVLTLLPVALQQSAFALLSIEGRHHTVSIGFIWSLLLLGITALALAAWPKVWLFLTGLAAANLVRLAWLRRQAGSATALT